MKTTCYIYQFLFLIISSVLFSQQDKVLVISGTDTTEYFKSSNPMPEPPDSIYTKSDSGHVRIMVELESDRFDNYKLTFTNLTNISISKFYIKSNDPRMVFDMIWIDDGDVIQEPLDGMTNEPFLGGNENIRSQYQIITTNQPLAPGESFYFHLDVDYGNPSFTGGFYVGDKLYEKQFTGTVDVGFNKSSKLIWKPNIEIDIDGYKVYIGEVPGVYDMGFQMVEHNETVFSLSFLETGIYYITVTAFDTFGNESGYAEEIVFEVQ